MHIIGKTGSNAVHYESFRMPWLVSLSMISPMDIIAVNILSCQLGNEQLILNWEETQKVKDCWNRKAQQLPLLDQCKLKERRAVESNLKLTN
jgi:hypothetical protein